MSFPPQQPGRLSGQQPGETRRSGPIVAVGAAVAAVVLAVSGTLMVTGEQAIAGKAVPQTASELRQPPGAGSIIRAPRELARRFATALSADTAAPLVEISCEKPNQAELEAFNAEAARYDHVFTVSEPPTVRGDVATGKMRGRVGELTFTLHRRSFGWCAEFQWSGLLD